MPEGTQEIFYAAEVAKYGEATEVAKHVTVLVGSWTSLGLHGTPARKFGGRMKGNIKDLD